MKFVCVVVIGVVGQIGYLFIFCIVVGEMFGFDQLVSLYFFEILFVMDVLCGMVMELCDVVYFLFYDIVVSDNVEEVFDGVDVVLLVGVCL